MFAIAGSGQSAFGRKTDDTELLSHGGCLPPADGLPRVFFIVFLRKEFGTK